MPTPTYDLLTSSVLSSNSTNVTFSSLNVIAAGYTDLILVADIIGNTSASNPAIRFNGDANNVYHMVNMHGDTFGIGGTYNTNTAYRCTLRADTQPNTSRRALFTVNLYDFTKSIEKSVFSRASTTSGVEATMGRWRNTSAITSVSWVALSDSFGPTSAFHLYGLVS